MLREACLALAAAGSLGAAIPARASYDLAAPVRCVGDYLDAVASAAPQRPRRARPSPAPTGAEPRWAHTREFLVPRAAAAVAAQGDKQHPLAAWSALGGDGALLGYELVAARRAPRGTVVVIARERTVRAPDAAPVTAACAYLVAQVHRTWRIADKRCGRDFADREVLSGYAGFWDEPRVLVLGDDAYGDIE